MNDAEQKIEKIKAILAKIEVEIAECKRILRGEEPKPDNRCDFLKYTK